MESEQNSGKGSLSVKEHGALRPGLSLSLESAESCLKALATSLVRSAEAGDKEIRMNPNGSACTRLVILWHFHRAVCLNFTNVVFATPSRWSHLSIANKLVDAAPLHLPRSPPTPPSVTYKCIKRGVSVLL